MGSSAGDSCRTQATRFPPIPGRFNAREHWSQIERGSGGESESKSSRKTNLLLGGMTYRNPSILPFFLGRRVRLHACCGNRID